MPKEPVCEICSTRRASLRMTALRVGHLGGRTFVCAQCALEDSRMQTTGGFNLAEFVLEAAGRQPGMSSRMGCPSCGTSLAEVITGGRMGCTVCYERFAGDVESALKTIHGVSVHRGKTPGS